MKLIITVDAEADDQWKRAGEPTVRNIAALPRFHELCKAHGAVPVYFTTYEVANDSSSAALLSAWQREGSAEIGAHLHPWTTPPYSPDDAKEKPFPSELTDDELRAKFIALHARIESAVGVRPRSYRAGRWGFDARQAALLAEFGYLADSSVTPLISWKKNAGRTSGAGGPDFRAARPFPYRLNDSVLEVPMTILNTGFLGREGGPFANLRSLLPAGLMSRALDALLLRPRWLRIFADTTRDDLARVVRAAERSELPALVFMIHSSELVAGGSPYVKDEEALARVYARLEDLFALTEEAGIAPAALAEFAAAYGRNASAAQRVLM